MFIGNMMKRFGTHPISTSCASRNFTVPSAAVWRVRKNLAAKAFPSALFHSLLLDFVIVQAYLCRQTFSQKTERKCITTNLECGTLLEVIAWLHFSELPPFIQSSLLPVGVLASGCDVVRI